MRLLFTSDLHGIMPAYERFAELLGSGSYDAGILAGDLLEGVLTDDQILELTGVDPDQLLDELPGDEDPAFTDWENRPRKRPELDADIAELSPLVDKETILVTHAPPYGRLDSTHNLDPRTRRASQIGLRHLRALRPRLHLFGHVHEAAGRKGRYVNGSWIELRKFSTSTSRDGE